MADKKEELIASLKKLLSDAPRTKMGRVFEIYESLVDLRNAGVSAGDIEKLLNDKDGVFKFDLPPGSLTSYMHRIKLKKVANQVGAENISGVVVKAKKPRKPKSTAEPGSEKLDVVADEKLPPLETEKKQEPERPPGLSNSAWNDMQIKLAKAKKT